MIQISDIAQPEALDKPGGRLKYAVEWKVIRLGVFRI
jgi:hypothetical protein